LSRRARDAGLLGAAIILAACGGGSSGGAAHRAASTTTATSSSGGSSVNIGIICSTPTDAASAVVNAWMAGNRAAARRCGTPTAVATLFARAAGPEGWVLQRCAGTVCSFTHPHGTVRLTMGGSDAAGWVVARVQFGR
jgi:hypothetical protein